MDIWIVSVFLSFAYFFLVRVLLWSLHIHHLPAMSYISCLDGEEKSENTGISFPSFSAPLLAESALSLLQILDQSPPSQPEVPQGKIE